MHDPARFLAPGSAVVEVAEPGRYVIWHEYRTVFDGRAFDTDRALPHGAQFRVAGPGGTAVEVHAYGGASSTTPGAGSVSVARFDALQPGGHAVSVEGAFPARVIAVGPDILWPLLKTLAAAFAAVVTGLGAGLAMGLYAFLGHGQEPGAPAGALAPEREKALRQLTAVVYGLQAGALLVGVTLLGGVIINYLKRREVEGTWLASHFTWQIRTFWWMLAWSVLGLALLLVLVGIPILLGATVWFVYRLAKGWTRLNDGRPMYGEVTSPRP